VFFYARAEPCCDVWEVRWGDAPGAEPYLRVLLGHDGQVGVRHGEVDEDVVGRDPVVPAGRDGGEWAREIVRRAGFDEAAYGWTKGVHRHKHHRHTRTHAHTHTHALRSTYAR